MEGLGCLVGRDGASKKLTGRDAELAFWFHVDPATMGSGRKAGYLANLERCKAQQTIHLGNFSPTDWQGVYQLYLFAFGDRKLAEKARVQAMELLVEQRCNRARQ